MDTKHIYFQSYNENHLPNHEAHNTNRLAYSSFKKIEDQGTVGGIAIKYVIQGLEEYAVGYDSHEVGDNQFLLLNQGTPFHVSIDTKDYTNGICVNLSTCMVKDVLRNFEAKEETLLDFPLDFDEMKGSIPIIDKIYPANESSILGNQLKKLAHQIESQKITDLSEHHLLTTQDVYYDLTLALLQLQGKAFDQMNKLSSVKRSTRKELYKRLSVAKEFIDENLDKGIDIQDISKVATISPFHFHRTFKAVYGLSPHQYRIQKRLGKAAELLMDIEHSVTEIAFLTGFADIHSFSRSFKKEFGIPPSKYRRFNDE
ncbi:MAG: AraC family transcriptional regulator [Chitinophagales bacterium]